MKLLSSFRKTIRRSWVGWVFIAPVIVGIIVFTLYPMAQSLYLSFFRRYNVISPPEGFGIFNYRKMFLGDKDFWQAIKVTFTYSAINIPLTLVLSFALALLLNSRRRGVGIYRLLIYTPVILPVTVSGLIWRDVVDVNFGIANKFLADIGLPQSRFFTAAYSSMPTLIVLGLWGLGGGMVLWLSALKNVPKHLYESAEIDGAGRVRQLFCITVPMITPTIFYNLIMSVIASLQTFGSVFVLTGGQSVDNALLFYVMKIYNDAFNIGGKTMGYAAAMSWILFLLIGALTLLVFKTSKWVFYGEEA